MRFLRHDGIYRSDVLINLDSAVPDSGDHQHARIGVAAERPPCRESPSPSTPPWRIGHPLRWKTQTPGADSALCRFLSYPTLRIWPERRPPSRIISSCPSLTAAFRSTAGRAKGRDGRSAPCSSSAMSSGRLFLDRVARQHCPSPLHRHPHPKTVPGWGTIKWQRTANSVLTVCLSQGDNLT